VWGEFLIFLVVLALAVVVTANAGALAVLFGIRDACDGATHMALMKILPVWGLSVVSALSAIVGHSWVTRKYVDEGVAPFFIEIFLIHVMVITTLLFSSMFFLPDARFFYYEFRCVDTGETYWAQVGAPFVMGAWASLMLFYIAFMVAKRRSQSF